MWVFFSMKFIVTLVLQPLLLIQWTHSNSNFFFLPYWETRGILITRSRIELGPRQWKHQILTIILIIYRKWHCWSLWNCILTSLSSLLSSSFFSDYFQRLLWIFSFYQLSLSGLFFFWVFLVLESYHISHFSRSLTYPIITHGQSTPILYLQTRILSSPPST